MKRIVTLAIAGLATTSATAYAAAPDSVVKAVEACCEFVLSCCGLGGCC